MIAHNMKIDSSRKMFESVRALCVISIVSQVFALTFELQTDWARLVCFAVYVHSYPDKHKILLDFEDSKYTLLSCNMYLSPRYNSHAKVMQTMHGLFC